MHQKSSKSFILGIIMSLVLLISIFSFSYAIFVYMRTTKTSIKLSAGTIMIGFSENSNGISLNNALPISDNDAISTNNENNENNYFDFYVTYNIEDNVSIDYEIDVVNSTLELDEIINKTLTSLPSTSVKVALLNNDTGISVLEPQYFSFIENIPASNNKEGYHLYTKSVTGSGRDSYRLYMWIPEIDSNGNYVNPFAFGENSIKEKTFSVKVNIQASANSN